MLAHLEMREARVWIETVEPAEVEIEYRSEDGEPHRTPPVQTTKKAAHTAVLTLDAVEPGTSYDYSVRIDGKADAATGRFTTPSFYHERQPPPDLRIAVGGAHYAVEDGFEPPYTMLGSGYGIFTTILESEPDMMLWLGNTAHLRPSDWTTESGYLKRFSRARSVPDLQPLLGAIPHYATWGAADFGSEDADRFYSYRRVAEASFRQFWPPPVDVAQIDGIATRIRRSDVVVFLLDTRSYRLDRPTSEQMPQALGAEQIQWLRQELMRSTATIKIVAAGAPILNPAKSKENLSFAEQEHTRFLQMFRDEAISGLVFLSGGKYYGELTRLVHANSYNLFDLTVGPLTAEPRDNEDELNFFRMPGTSVFERHFALLDVTGPEDARKVTFRVLSMEGEELWSRSVNAAELSPPSGD